ncbi:MAG: aminotransferase class III-fold pyridoxal phosphate-dependent enzyme, partial [Gammaproteobacteria bacterium]|nr:aminotransferase class III-fold pyridoxal phosphate-dependent enzyme [Gammaproteobacteria bacterium]
MPSENEIRFLLCEPPSFDLGEIRTMVGEIYGIKGDYQPLHGERDQNFRIAINGEDRYVLKISNLIEKPELIDFQLSALEHIAVQNPALAIPLPASNKQGLQYSSLNFSNGQTHFVRLLHFVPGIPLTEVNSQYSTTLGRNIGKTLASLDIALRGFFHPAANHDHPWDLGRGSRLVPFTHHIKDGLDQKMVRGVLSDAAQSVEPALLKLRRQVIHQDAHRGNILVSQSDPSVVTGIVDFGDLLYGTLAAEVALAGMSTMQLHQDTLEAFCDTAAAFDDVLPLSEEEIDLVFDLICIRHAMIATVFATRIANGHGNSGHVEAQAEYIERLAGLQRLGRSKTTTALRRACCYPVRCPDSPAEAASEDAEQALLATRYGVLGRHTKHFYEKPLHFERSLGPYLYGMDGRRYLDFYNNVPQVGHCNPHVVKAISRQAAALNTNTRYLYGSVLEYAERLTSKLAPHLDSCIFVNSGSEANDVAWQMARFVTGNSGGMLMEDAYHGITDPIRLFSPGHPDVQLPAFLQGLAVPDAYRDTGDDIAARYAADADRAIRELAQSGHALAAFIVDSAFCSSGVPDVPPGYLRGVEERVRKAGGLMICDEVQSGFGRMGQWWGHEFHGVRADIVTMGK